MILVIPAGADRDLRADGRQPPPGLGGLRRDDDAVRRRRRAHLRRRGPTRPPAMHAAGVAGANLEGKEQRFGIASLVAVRGRHHRRLLRRGQRRDGVAHRPRRRRPDGADDDRRGDLRRRRLGPLRDAAVRHPRRLHLRADGRAHAGVPRQEDRGARDQARRSSARSPCRCWCSSRPRWRSARSGARRRSTTAGPQGFSETLYAYVSQGNNNGSAFAGYTGYLQPERHATTARSGSRFADLLGGAGDARRALPADAGRARRRRLARRQARVARRASARCAPTRRPSSSC